MSAISKPHSEPDLREWAHTPHAQLGFSTRQLEVQRLFEQYDRLTVERDTFKQTAQFHAEKAKGLKEQYQALRDAAQEVYDYAYLGLTDNENGAMTVAVWEDLQNCLYPESSPAKQCVCVGEFEAHPAAGLESCDAPDCRGAWNPATSPEGRNP